MTPSCCAAPKASRCSPGRSSPHRAGLCGPPVRSAQSPARRRPCRAARGSRRHPWPTPATCISRAPGRRPFARSGDGRAPLGPMLREAVVGEFLHAAGVPTTRALAVLSTGERIAPRQGVTPEPGAILVRVAASHLRVGTFEYAAWNLGPTRCAGSSTMPSSATTLRPRPPLDSARGGDERPGRAARAVDAAWGSCTA